jgi:hypothetical protein
VHDAATKESSFVFMTLSGATKARNKEITLASAIVGSTIEGGYIYYLTVSTKNLFTVKNFGSKFKNATAKCSGNGIGTLLVSIAREICIACSGTSSMYIMAGSGSVGFWRKMSFKESVYNDWPSSVKMMALIAKEDGIAIAENDISTPISFFDLPSVHAPDKRLHYMKRWEDAVDNCVKVNSFPNMVSEEERSKAKTFENKQRVEYKNLNTVGVSSELNEGKLRVLEIIGLPLKLKEEFWNVMFESIASRMQEEKSLTKSMTNWWYEQRKLFEKENPSPEEVNRKKRLLDMNYTVPKKKSKYIVSFEDNLRAMRTWLVANGANTIPQKVCLPSKQAEGGVIPIGTAFMRLKKLRNELVQKERQGCMTEEDKQKQAIINKYLTFEVMGTVVTKTFPSNDPSDAISSKSTTNNTSNNADVPSDLNDTVVPSDNPSEAISSTITTTNSCSKTDDVPSIPTKLLMRKRQKSLQEKFTNK